MTDTEQPSRLLRIRQVFGRSGLIPVHPSTGWAWIKRGDFPQPLLLNPGERRSVVAFREEDVTRWMAERPEGLGRPLAAAAYEARREKAQQRRAANEAPVPTRRKLPMRRASSQPVAEDACAE